MDNWIKIFGMPEGILTDGGGEFKDVWNELLKLLKIHHFATTPYHPQANGLVESKNRMMTRILRKHCEDPQSRKNWDKFVTMAMLEYNCTENDITKETPYFLVFGKEPRTPMDIVLKIKPFESSFVSKHWREDFLMNLYQGLKQASSRIEEQQRKNAERWLSKVRA